MMSRLSLSWRLACLLSLCACSDDSGSSSRCARPESSEQSGGGLGVSFLTQGCAAGSGAGTSSEGGRAGQGAGAFGQGSSGQGEGGSGSSSQGGQSALGGGGQPAFDCDSDGEACACSTAVTPEGEPPPCGPAQVDTSKGVPLCCASGSWPVQGSCACFPAHCHRLGSLSDCVCGIGSSGPSEEEVSSCSKETGGLCCATDSGSCHCFVASSVKGYTSCTQLDERWQDVSSCSVSSVTCGEGQKTPQCH